MVFRSFLMDDKALLQHIIKGDHDAFRILVERYCEALFVFAMRMSGDNYLSEDIVQDAFETVWSEKKKLNPSLSIRSYLYGIVKNKCLVAIRSSKVSEKYRSSLQNNEEDIIDKFIETETMRLLVGAIEALPPRTGEVIRLSMEGMRQEKIAEEMNITVATVKALKADGLKKLKRTLGTKSFMIFLTGII